MKFKGDYKAGRASSFCLEDIFRISAVKVSISVLESLS